MVDLSNGEKSQPSLMHHHLLLIRPSLIFASPTTKLDATEQNAFFMNSRDIVLHKMCACKSWPITKDSIISQYIATNLNRMFFMDQNARPFYQQGALSIAQLRDLILSNPQPVPLIAPRCYNYIHLRWHFQTLYNRRRANANLGRSPEPPHRSFHTLGFISSQTQTAQRGSIGSTHC